MLPWPMAVAPDNHWIVLGWGGGAEGKAWTRDCTRT